MLRGLVIIMYDVDVELPSISVGIIDKGHSNWAQPASVRYLNKPQIWTGVCGSDSELVVPLVKNKDLILLAAQQDKLAASTAPYA